MEAPKDFTKSLKTYGGAKRCQFGKDKFGNYLLSQISAENEYLKPEQRWPFSLFIDNPDIKEKFILVTRRVMQIAEALPSGSYAFTKWSRVVKPHKLSFVALLTQELRVYFPYMNLSKWMEDFDYALLTLSTTDSEAKAQLKKYNEMKITNNQQNWNKLRVPFVFGAFHYDKKSLEFKIEDWIDAALAEKKSAGT